MSLLNPFFLLGLAAIAVPVLIHILQRDRLQRVIFPATRFLLGASRKITRTQQWRELLLMLVRCAAVALLAIALCRPFFIAAGKGGADAAALGARALVLAVDVSASMRIGARMEEAKKQALEALGRLRPQVDRAALLVFDFEPQVAVAMTGELSEIKAALEKVEAGFGAGNLASALQQADRLLQNDELQEFAREVVVCSDFQRTGWSAYTGDWRFSPGTQVTVKPVTLKAPENVALVQAAMPRSTVASPRTEVLSLKVTHFGKEERKPVKVAFSAAGAVVDEKEVTLRPGKSEIVRFSYKFEQAGDAAGAFTVQAQDEFPLDDAYHFAVRVLPRIQVLLINGGPHRIHAQDDGYFLKQALALEGAPFQAREVRPEAVTPADFDALDAVVLANVRELPPDAVARMEKFLEGGGGALFFAGDNVDPELFNKNFGPVAPCRLKQIVARKEGEDGLTLAEVDYRHRIFTPFASPQSGEFGKARFMRYALVTDSQSARVLARYLDGRPALLEETKGRGLSLLFTSSAGLKWNDFCLQGGVFVPFVHEAVRYLAVRGEAITTAQVGQPMSFELKTAKAEMTLPGEGAPKVHLEQGSAAFVPKTPGLYVLSDGPRTERFAVNVDAAESDLAMMDSQELVSAVTANPEGRTQEIEGVKVLVAASATARERLEKGQRIGWYLLLVLLGLLVAEHLLANSTSRN